MPRDAIWQTNHNRGANPLLPEDQNPAQKKPRQAGVFIQGTAQISERPLFAAMRMRKALSLMKPAASAWL